jgi:hypothetical protein
MQFEIFKRSEKIEIIKNRLQFVFCVKIVKSINDKTHSNII